MTSERIKQIQQQTAYPDSISVQQALLRVWNECSPVLPPVTGLATEIKSTLTAIEDEINQYREGNLTIEMCVTSVIQLVKELEKYEKN
jgi:hypothetical protein